MLSVNSKKIMEQQYFSLLKNQKKLLLVFHKILSVSYKMETQKIINLLNDSNYEEFKFATKKWYVIENQTAKGKYNQNNSIKFETKSCKLNPCVYIDAFVLVIGDLAVTANNNTDVAFKNCAPFSTCKTEINDVFIDEENHNYIAMPRYNLIEYSDIYSNTSESLLLFKRDEFPNNNADLTIDNSQSFKYKEALVANAINNTKIL